MWGEEGGHIIASFSELIGWESMEGNQEAEDKRWQQRLLERGPIDAKTHTHTHSQIKQHKESPGTHHQ